MVEPAEAFSATFIAPAKVAPPDVPQKMPSCCASFLAMARASLPSIAVTGTVTVTPSPAATVDPERAKFRGHPAGSRGALLYGRDLLHGWRTSHLHRMILAPADRSAQPLRPGGEMVAELGAESRHGA